MNPLDNEEFTKLLQTIKKDMPIHTDTTAKIKCSFSQGMPKNLMNYSRKIDNEFLNSNLAIIEEISHRDSKHWIPKWFKQYQKKIYGDSEILNHDNFFKATLHDIWRECYEKGIPFPKISGSMRSMSIQNVAFLAPKSIVVTEIETDGSTGTATNSSASQLEAGKCTVFASGGLYNQMKIKLATAAGNTRVALYSDSASVPSTLLSESSSLTAVAGYTTNYAITEVQVNSTTAWMAHNRDTEVGMTWEYWSNGSRAYKAFAYGAMPAPFGTPDATNALSPKCKASHS